MEKNQIVEAVCERLGSNGEGVCRADGMPLFVKGLLTGERAMIKILSVKRDCAYGKAMEILNPAEERVRPACPVFLRCGGCQLQHMSYRAQASFKSALVKNTLGKIAGIQADVAPCIRSKSEYNYRNKLILPIGDRDGKLVAGFYAERSHRIVETDVCPLTAWAGKVISALKKFASVCGLDGYDEETGKGQLRHIVVREIDGKYLVVLVVTEEIKGIDYLISLLDGVFDEYSFFLNFNSERTNVIFGKRFVRLKGEATYEGEEEGIRFEGGVQTFLQVNADVRTKLYREVVGQVAGDGCAIDCYSGGGLLTAMLAKKCAHAYGIEIVREATECADRLKEKNGLQGKMTNITGRVEDELPALLKGKEKVTLILDPPRAGVARSVLRTVEASGVERVIMISCDPATLARDVGILTGTLTENERGELIKCDNGQGAYEIISVQPFDMFPQTKHVETLVVLFKKSDKSYQR